MSFLGPIEKYGEYSELFIFSLGCFIWGTAGIPMIVRQEVQPFLESGRWAVFFGFIHPILGWGLAFILLIYNIFFRGNFFG